jgi:hypothetical protein
LAKGVDDLTEGRNPIAFAVFFIAKELTPVE